MLRPLRIFNFGGLNTSRHASQIGDTESPDLLNVIVRDGTVRTRPGIAKLVDETGTAKTQGLFHYKTQAGAIYRVRCQNGKIEAKIPSATSWTTLKTGLSTTAQWSAAVANDYIYLMNGTDTPQRWNGSDASTTAVASVKNGTTCYWKFDRLIVCGVSGGESVMWYSDEGAPETFGANNWFYVGKQDGGTVKQILDCPFGVTLLKDSGRFEWGGQVTSQNGPKKVSSFGSPGLRSGVTLPDGSVWHFSRHGIRRTFGTDDQLMSGDITGTLKTLNWNYADKIAAEYFDNYVIFAVPGTGATNNDHWLLYDLIRKGWLWWDLQASTLLACQCAAGKPTLLFGNSAGNSKTYSLGDPEGVESTFNDDGVAINAYYITKAFDLGAPDKLKKFHKLFYALARQATSYYATVSYNVDESGWADYLIPLFTGSALTYDSGLIYDTPGLKYDDAVKVEGILSQFKTGWCRTLQLKVGINAADEPFRLFALAPYYRVKRTIK